jgi:hypothetical protein
MPGSCRFNSAWLKGKKSLRAKKASVDSANLQLRLQKFKRPLGRCLVLNQKPFVDQRRPAFDRVGLKASRLDRNHAQRKKEKDLESHV